jgi:hypothetical protein
MYVSGANQISLHKANESILKNFSIFAPWKILTPLLKFKKNTRVN